MKKSLVIFYIALVVLLLLLYIINVSVQTHDTPNLVTINEDTSCFDDFQISNGNVFFLCTYTLNNSSDTPVLVKLTGDFFKEYKLQLIQETKLQAITTDITMTSLINEQFLAEANLTAGYPGSEIELQPGDNEIKVLYIGTHAGGSQKSNRLLPDTKIEICNK